MSDVSLLHADRPLTVGNTNTSSPFRTNSGINPYTGAWTTNEVVHLLKRTMFGAKWADIQYYKSKNSYTNSG